MWKSELKFSKVKGIWAAQRKMGLLRCPILRINMLHGFGGVGPLQCMS